MGCPKKFSLQGGMGSALLRDPERVRHILSTLVRGLSIPVTCKIRILEDDAATLSLLHTIASTGVAAITIHPRLPHDRTEKVPANYDRLRRILTEAGDLKVPIILSGDVMNRKQAAAAKEATGAVSVMIARGAMWNVSAFGEAFVHKLQYAQQYLWYSLYYGNAMGTAKYVLTRSFQTEGKAWLPIFEKLQAARTIEDLCMACGMAPDPRYSTERPPPGPAIGWLGLPPTTIFISSTGASDPKHTDEKKALTRAPDHVVNQADSSPKRQKSDSISEPPCLGLAHRSTTLAIDASC
eukprot:GGOE01044650.1.p1 GENE.GGOE01044650.1~~GGOE01044650.1.p1  ORF type:complete len:295 (+),score=57.44 GGOE01044650.1:216-1100(+)